MPDYSPGGDTAQGGSGDQKQSGTNWLGWAGFGADLISSIFGGMGGGGMSEGQKRDQRFMNSFAMDAALRGEDYQKNYMQYRSADAAAAGLHPLAALGVNVGSGPSAPAFVGAGGPSNSKGDNTRRMLSSMGQDVSRAISAVQTQEQRLMTQAAMEKTRAETDYAMAMAAESRKRTAAIGSNPAMPDPYSGQFNQDAGSGVPNKHHWVRTANGYELQFTPEFSASMMSRPVSMMIEDLADRWDVNSEQLRNALMNMGGPLKSQMRRSFRRLTGDRNWRQ